MKSLQQNTLDIPTGTVDVGGQQLHYLIIGSGPKLVLAFHGYANDASLFHFLLHPEYTVLSFDLPFQGKSVGVEGHLLNKVLLQEMVSYFMIQYKVQKIGLVGFSLGARVCLCIAEQMPAQLRNIILIAPDGLVHNYFYRMLTGTFLGRFCFRGFVKFGDYYIRLFSFLHRTGMVNRSMYKFAMQYIRTRESRRMLYNIWMSTSKLIPRLNSLKSKIRSGHIPVHLLMGQNDQVIPVKNALQFKGNNSHIILHVFERGHNMLDFEEVRGTACAWLFRTKQAAKTL